MGKQWKKAGKTAQSAKKAVLFTRLARAVQAAVRLGGPDPEGNHRLKMALNTARAHSLPKDTINRALKSSKAEGAVEELLFEGFGPHGAAVLVHCLTDNRVRTVSEMRLMFKTHKGRMGESGSVLWMFNKTAIIKAFPKSGPDVMSAEDTALAVGANDIEPAADLDTPTEESKGQSPAGQHPREGFIFYADKQHFYEVQKKLTQKNWEVQSAHLGYTAKNKLTPPKEHQKEIQDFLNLFECNPDCQNVYSNYV